MRAPQVERGVGQSGRRKPYARVALAAAPSRMAARQNRSIIVVTTIIAALITTYIPARQASPTYPAKALLFE